MALSRLFKFAVSKRELVMVKHSVCLKPNTAVLLTPRDRNGIESRPQGVIVSWLFWQLRIDFKF